MGLITTEKIISDSVITLTKSENSYLTTPNILTEKQVNEMIDKKLAKQIKINKAVRWKQAAKNRKR